MTPKDLVDRLEHNKSIQLQKSFDVFISHSSKDASAVRSIMSALNKQGFVCYCDCLHITVNLHADSDSDCMALPTGSAHLSVLTA